MDARPAGSLDTCIDGRDEAAAQWLVRLTGGEADGAMIDAFDRWLNEDPSHCAAFDSICALWELLAPSLAKPFLMRAPGRGDETA